MSKRECLWGANVRVFCDSPTLELREAATPKAMASGFESRPLYD